MTLAIVTPSLGRARPSARLGTAGSGGSGVSAQQTLMVATALGCSLEIGRAVTLAVVIPLATTPEGGPKDASCRIGFGD